MFSTAPFPAQLYRWRSKRPKFQSRPLIEALTTVSLDDEEEEDVRRRIGEKRVSTPGSTQVIVQNDSNNSWSSKRRAWAASQNPINEYA
jgi:hypothetical protein